MKFVVIPNVCEGSSPKKDSSSLRSLGMTFFIMLTMTSLAFAQDSFYLEDLTWQQVKARMAQGTDTMIIPTGGTEQNGPAIAIGKHNWIVGYTSGEIARTLGNALAAPVIAYVPEGNINPPEGHMNFPGTISLTDEHYGAMLEDTARSFKQEGFKYIFFLGDSGGNQDAQVRVAQKLSQEWKKEGVLVASLDEYYADKEAIEWAKSKKLGGEDPSAHAGFMDASEARAAHGENAVRPALFGHYDTKDYATTGSIGDPSQSSLEYGKQLLAFKVKTAVEQIKRLTKTN